MFGHSFCVCTISDQSQRSSLLTKKSSYFDTFMDLPRIKHFLCTNLVPRTFVTFFPQIFPVNSAFFSSDSIPPPVFLERRTFCHRSNSISYNCLFNYFLPPDIRGFVSVWMAIRLVTEVANLDAHCPIVCRSPTRHRRHTALPKPQTTIKDKNNRSIWVARDEVWRSTVAFVIRFFRVNVWSIFCQRRFAEKTSDLMSTTLFRMTCIF